MPPHVDRLEDGLSYHNYYHYSHWQDCQANKSDVSAHHKAVAAAYYTQAAAIGKPVLASEFGQSECYCPAATAIQHAGVGWIAWELIAGHDQFGGFQGLFHVNGTARSEAEVKCLRALGEEAGV